MAGKQKFKEDSIGALSKVNATTVELAASLVTIGGLQYDTGTLSLSTLLTGVGGLDAGPVQNNKVYNVFAILSSEEPALIASLSSTPSGYTVYTKVGAFNSSGTGDVNGASEKDQGKVGDVIHSMLTEEQFIAENGAGWALADGRDVTGSKYDTLILGGLGGNIPDMRGQFLRGKNNGRADGNEDSEGERDIGSLQLDKTRRPRDTNLTSNSQGSHRHSLYSSSFNADHIVGGVGGSNSHAVAAINNNIGGQGYYSDMGADGADVTNTTGNHTHTITGGGDPETQPKNVVVNIFIKIEDIN